MLKNNYCEICNTEVVHLNTHIKKHNITSEEYYLKYIGDKGYCTMCGSPTVFISINKGYRQFCCRSCSAKHTTTLNTNAIAKRKNTCLQKYGVEHPAQSKCVINKIKSTNLEKYGVAYTLASNKVRNKIKQTNLTKYGVENVAQSDIVKQKVKQTNLAKYGVCCNLIATEIKEQIRQNNLLKYGNETHQKIFASKTRHTKQSNIKTFCADNDATLVIDLIRKYGQGWYKAKIVDVLRYKEYSFVRNSDISKIEAYCSVTKSRPEKEIADFIASIYNGSIVRNTRKVIAPFELDIYIPDMQIAIEFNGAYWHSLYDNKYYHLNKTKLCESLGIRLIHIAEWEWRDHSEICKSIIKDALGLNTFIDASQCECRDVIVEDEHIFLDENHIYGYAQSHKRYGLYYKNKLVQLLTINTITHKQNEVEIVRICTKLNTTVVNGFSRLLSCIDKYNIVSYIDISKFDCKSFYKVGFKFDSYIEPSFVYVRGNEILHKYNINDIRYNDYTKYYDCGKIKVVKYAKP